MSTKPRIYLDFNATAPLGADVRVAMTRGMESWGNPSSIHAEGRRARDAIEQARERVAQLAGRTREQVVFTSGGTEGNALGVMGLALVAEQRGLPRVIASAAIDHPSLRGAVAALVARGWRAAPIAVTAEGALEAIALDGVGLVAVAAANHELGTMAGPEVIAAARAAGALVHVDAVQAAGKIALAAIDADALVLSAHKLGGPQGVGALAIACDGGLPLVDAGHQERGRRPGTENALGIVGFGAAAERADAASWPAVAALGEQLEAGLRAIEGVRIHGAGAPRVGGTVNAGFAGARGESLVIALDLAGIAVSTGAACTSGAIEPSPVLLAIGQSPERAREAVRFSLGRTTTAAEIDAVLEALPPIVARARAQRR
ncbi:MAG TPA: aminotransferase class V-fold PLP-dependent enzyme [Kofleriaceae bacterium]|nr:aminotransferase class V-fold PLP-dependent enzyme [Kofleriaceae bacterium]